MAEQNQSGDKISDGGPLNILGSLLAWPLAKIGDPRWRPVEYNLNKLQDEDHCKQQCG